MNKNQELAIKTLQGIVSTPIQKSAGRGYVVRYGIGGILAVRLTDQDISEMLAADLIYATKNGYELVVR